MKRLHFALLLFVCSILSAHAQTVSKKLPKDCNALLARQLVEQQADESKSVAETDKRVNILLRVADFLWVADEEAARKYFAEAFKVAQDRFREKGIERKEKDGMQLTLPDYRFDVIEAIAKRDAEWAKKLAEILLKEFDENAEKDKRDDSNKTREVEEILDIAARVAKDNPNLALMLARRVMRYPLGGIWYWTLFEMAGKNRTLADQIYTELLANYPNAKVFQLLYLSAYPFGNERIFGVEKYSLGASVPDDFAANKNLQRQFLLTLFNRVLKLTAENTAASINIEVAETAGALMALNELEPIVIQQFPDLMPRFSQAKIHADSITNAADLKKAKESDESGKGFYKSFDENLAEVERLESVGELKDYNIFNLVNSAKKDDDYKKAESWIDKMSEEAARTGTTNFFYFNRSKLATKGNRLEDARKYALRVPKIEHRAVLFFGIAEAKLKEPMTKSESLDTLLEVSQTAQKSPDTLEKAQVLLGTAFMYEKIDHFAALGVLAEAIKTTNKLDNPNLFTGYVLQIVKGKRFSHYSGYEVPGFNINRTFYELSKNDFQNALTYATDFSDGYLRTLAVLAVVKDCEKNAKPVKNKAIK